MRVVGVVCENLKTATYHDQSSIYIKKLKKLNKKVFIYYM